STGENLLQGYKKLGKCYLYLFLLLNLITSSITIAGVTYVTSALATLIFPSFINIFQLSIFLIASCTFLTLIGKYRWLDKSMKYILCLLVITTVLAFLGALLHGPVAPKGFLGPEVFSLSTLPFLVALVGWMPAPVEMSVWQSLWVQEHQKNSLSPITIEQSKFDFDFGYFLTIFIAVIFILLGALTMYGTGYAFSSSAPEFASQLINIYVS